MMEFFTTIQNDNSHDGMSWEIGTALSSSRNYEIVISGSGCRIASHQQNVDEVGQGLSGIAFIDSGLEDYQSLVAGIAPGIEVVVLESTQNGVEQISRVLAKRQRIGSIHIVSHGAPGAIYIGNSELSLETLNHYGNELLSWADWLAPNAEVLIYGCKVAKGDHGQAFIHRLSELTGASIHASATKTGCAALGGDWNLDFLAASPHPFLNFLSFKRLSLAFTANLQQSYQGVLELKFTLVPPLDGTNGTNSVVFGDFNGDGNVDLVHTNSNSSNFQVYLGNGNGLFTGPTTFTTGSLPQDITTGDFNKDGKLDLAVANQFASSVSIFLGNGNGGFSTGSVVAVGPPPIGNFGSQPFDLAIGDINSDGNQDLVTAQAASNSVFILLGNGNGGFTTTELPIGSRSTSVHLADFNADGKQDLAVTRIGSNNVAILLGNGNGGFGAATDYAVGTTPWEVTAADFNGDGRPDLVVANRSSNNVSILLNNGSGGFNPATNYTVGSDPRSLTVGDFNVDGKLDVVVSNFASNFVSVLLGDGSGNFAAATNVTVSTANTTEGLAVGDVNADGVLDLAVTSHRSTVILVNAPGVTNVSSPAANGTYIVGQTIPITVTFNDTVIVSGTPQLLLETGTTDRYANYVSGSGSNTLTFQYTVQAGDVSSDLNYASTNALELNGGTIEGTNGSNAVLFLPATNSVGSLATNKAIIIDPVPAATSVTVPADGTYVDGQALNFTVNFSQAVTVNTASGTPILPVTLDSGTVNATYVSGSGSNALVFRYTVSSGNLDINGISVGNAITLNGATIRNSSSKNAALTLNGIGSTTNVLVDAVNPAIANVSSITPDGTYTLGDSIGVTVTFNEVVNVTGTPQLILETGTTDAIANYTSGSGTNTLTFTYTVAPGNTNPDLDYISANALTLNGGTIKDAAGNNALLPLPTPGTAGSLGANKAITILSNTSPSFTANANLTTVAEDTTNPSGQTISTVFNGLFSDPDAGASLSGVAVVGNTANATTQGTWQYSTDGTTWFDVGTVADSATALALSASTVVRFVPVANYNGAPPALTVRAIDNTYTSGFTSGGTRINVNTGTNGGTTAISATTNTINTSITAVNDAPTGSPTATLATGTEDTAYTITTASLSQGFTDVEGNTLSVANLVATNGSITSNGNGTYTFQPTANYNGTVTLNYDVVDDNGGVTAATQSFSLAAVADVSLAAGTTPTEAGTTGNFVITLDAPAPVGGLTIKYNLSGSTATTPADFSLTAGNNIIGLTGGSFTIAAGATTGTLQVAAVNDGIVDPNETVRLNLISGSGYTLAYNPSPSFRAAPLVSVGPFPAAFTLGDVNGDGKLDIVTSTITSAVSIRLGDGAGNFTSTPDVPVGGYASRPALGDFNGDDKLDFATANANTNTVSVRLGDGTGNFTGTTNITIAGSPASVVLGDFNGDRKLDFATANSSAGTVSVRLGDGTGNFTGTTSAPVGTNPLAIALGDFNGDDKLDFATANANANTVSVRLGDGTGNFTGTTEVSVGTNPQAIALGDVNGDGKLDFTTANYSAGTVSVRLGDGTGNFTVSPNVSVGNSPRGLALGDINGDGKLDLAATIAGNLIALRFGDGAGNFTGSSNVSTGGPDSFAVALGDLNGDGNLDVTAVNHGIQAFQGSVSVLLNNTGSAALTITDAPNIAPSFTGNATLAAISEDTTTLAGQTITTLFSGLFSDPNPNSSLSGVAVVGNTANTNTQGVWQYSTDGSNWYAIGTVNDGATALALSATTAVRFVPAANYNGTPPAITVRALDNTYSGAFTSGSNRIPVNTGSRGGATAISAATNTISTSVTPVNDLPTGTVTITGTAEQGQTLTAANTLADAEGLGAVTYTWFANGVSTGITGATYTLTQADVGKVFTVTASYTDGQGTAESFTSDATGTVVNVNDAPTGSATATLINGTEDTVYTITASELLQGFSDVDGDTLEVSDLTSTNGSLVNNNDGTYSFTPAANFNGAVELSYDVVDGKGGSVAATQSLVIAAVNDAPVLATNALSITEGATVILSASNLNTTDSDTPATGLTYTVSNVTGGQFESVGNPGTAITSFTQDNINNGAVQFVHNGGEAAPGYSVSVSDGEFSTAPTSATTSFTSVNDAPTLATNALSITEGGTVTFSSSNLNTSDSDNTPAQPIYTISNISGGSFSGTGVTTNGNGTVSFSQEAINNGLVQFTHDGGENPPSYAVSVSDGALNTTPATVTIPAGSFTPVNDAPVLATNTLSITEGGTVTLSSSNLNTSDSDNTPAQLIYTISNISGGTFSGTGVTTNSNGTVSFTQEAINNGLVQFTHDGGENPPSYAVSVSDGALNTTPATVTISAGGFTPVNDAPVLATNTLSITEGGTVTLSSSNLNTSDSDNTPAQLIYTISNISGGNFSGTGVTTNSNGTVSFSQNAINNGLVQFTHNGGENPPSYAVSVSDGALNTTPVTVTIPAGSFTPVNDAPVLATNTLSITEGGTVTLSSSNLNISDPDNTPAQLIYTVSSISGGSFSGTGVTNNSNGSVSFSQNAINNGLVQFTHNGGENPPSYAVSVSDGALNTTPVTVTIPAGSFTPVNDAPVATGDTATTSQNTAVSINVLANDSDIEGNSLSLSLGNNPSNGTVQINNNGTASILSDDFLTYTPNNGFSGTDSFNYTINDGNGGTATATVTVAVGKTQDGTNKDDLLDGTSGNDIFRGDNGQDTLNGFAGDDLLDGGNGKDTLDGGIGNDTLLGGNGEDVLVGGDGNDLLIGGNSPDTLTGGSGSDIFAIAKNGANDTITDFSLGQGDRIGLSEGLTFGELSFQGNNILRGTEVLATLTGFNTTTFTQANFITV